MKETIMAPRLIQKNPDRLALKLKEAALALGVSRQWLAQQARMGDVPHFRAGRVLLFPIALLQEWMKAKSAPIAQQEAQQTIQQAHLT